MYKNASILNMCRILYDNYIMSNEYIEKFKQFHRDRMFSQDPSKPQKCAGCSNPMKFQSKDSRLVLSCGSQGKGACGEQYEINMPEYVRYSEEIEGINAVINGNYYDDDPRDLSSYPLEKLHKLTKLSKDETEAMKHQSGIVEKAHHDMGDLKKQYRKQNNVTEYKKNLQELHGLKQSVSRKRTRLMAQIKQETDDSKKTELIQDYSKTSRVASEVYTLIQALNEKWMDYITIKTGSISHYNDTFEKKEKTKKPRKDKPKQKPKTKPSK